MCTGLFALEHGRTVAKIPLVGKSRLPVGGYVVREIHFRAATTLHTAHGEAARYTLFRRDVNLHRETGLLREEENGGFEFYRQHESVRLSGCAAYFDTSVGQRPYLKHRLIGLPFESLRQAIQREDFDFGNRQAGWSGAVDGVDGCGRLGHTERDVLIVGFAQLTAGYFGQINRVDGQPYRETDYATGTARLRI